MTHDVIVIGGGISGLAAAWKARGAGKKVVLLEAESRVGGCIQTVEVGGGARYDAGASSLLLKSEAAKALFREAKLEPIEPATKANRRFILTGGRLVKLPLGPAGFFATPLFSAGDKLRLLGEPFRRKAPAEAEETIAEFAVRRLGESFLDNAIGPFVSGVYAGDPDRLAMRWAVPALWTLEQEHGSLIRGATARRSGGGQRGAGAPPAGSATGGGTPTERGPMPRGKLVNFKGGLQAMPETLAAGLGDVVRRSHTVERVGPGFTVEGRSPSGAFSFQAPRLVVAVPGRALPPLLGAIAPEAAAFAELPYANVTSVFLGWKNADLPSPPSGFGFLRSRTERSVKMLGCLYTSALWPDRTPSGESGFTLFYGGRTDPETAALPDLDLITLASKELAPLIGASAPPVHAATRRWSPAIPQMEKGHGRFVEAADAIEKRLPGLTLAGNYRKGVSVGDCIERALSIPV